MSMRRLRQRERYTGGKVPFGFALGDDGRLVDVESEQAVIWRAKRMRKDGMSYRIIAAILAGDGFVDRTGDPVHPNKIRRMVLSG